MNNIRKLLREHWRLVAAICLAVIIVCVLMLYRLGSLTGGVSNDEVSQRAFADSWRHIATNPFYAPLTVLQWLLLTFMPHQGQTVTRLASTVFGVLAAAALAYVLRRWYGVRTAIYGTVLFGMSAWFLHVSRYAGPDVLYLWAIPTLLATHLAWERHSSRPVVTYLALSVFAILLYIPGMFWVLLLSLGLQSHQLVKGWQELEDWRLRAGLGGLLFLLLLPLFIAVIRDSSLLQLWLGLPGHFASAGEIPGRLLHSISYFIWRGPVSPQLWLEHLPLLDFFATVMGVLGALFYAKHTAAPRTRLLFGLFLVGAVFFALGGPVTISILVPLVYFVVIAGVGYLLHDWLRVFPRNPLARGIGFGLVGLAITLACAYNLRSYFIAWPHNQATKTTFHNRL